MDRRTMIGQDRSYQQDSTEKTYSFVIYVERWETDVLITSDDGWYGVRTFQFEDEDEAHRAFRAIVADPKPELQRLLGEPCDWFEPYAPELRIREGVDAVLDSDAKVQVTLRQPGDA